MTVTMDGAQGADLLELVRPRLCLPVHHDDHGVFVSPLSDFLDEVGRRGLGGVHVLQRGDALALPPPRPWTRRAPATWCR